MISRFPEATVPPIPKDATPAEMHAYRLWRRGHGLHEAARMAGFSHIRLSFLLSQQTETVESVQ